MRARFCVFCLQDGFFKNLCKIAPKQHWRVKPGRYPEGRMLRNLQKGAERQQNGRKVAQQPEN